MAETFTNKLEKFFDNNTPGGYITTSVSISDSDLDQRINTAVKTEVSGQGFAKASELSSYVKITSLASVATSGSYNDLKDKPTIPAATSVSVNRNLTEGTKIATITVNGSATELFAPVNNENGTSIGTIDYLQLINRPTLDNKDNFANIAFSGDYNDLINQPNENNLYSFSRVAFSSNYNDLNNRPMVVQAEDLATVAFSGKYEDLDLTYAPEESPGCSAFLLKYSASNKLQYLGQETTYIEDIDTTFYSGETTILSFFINLINQYQGSDYIIKLISLYDIYYITSCYEHKNNNEIQYYSISLTPTLQSNYGDFLSNNNLQIILNDLSIMKEQILLIIDIINNRIFIKKIQEAI